MEDLRWAFVPWCPFAQITFKCVLIVLITRTGLKKSPQLFIGAKTRKTKTYFTEIPLILGAPKPTTGKWKCIYFTKLLSYPVSFKRFLCYFLAWGIFKYAEYEMYSWHIEVWQQATPFSCSNICSSALLHRAEGHPGANTTIICHWNLELRKLLKQQTGKKHFSHFSRLMLSDF